MIKVLFVCLGNICRSPMAQFVFKQMVAEKGWIDRFEIVLRRRKVTMRCVMQVFIMARERY